MEISKYREIAARIYNDELNLNESVTRYGLGLTQSIGNVIDLIKQHMFCDVPIDKGIMINELSEALWNIANPTNVLGINLDEIAGHSVNTILMNKPNQTINLDNGIKRGGKVLFQGSKYFVDGSIGNLLLISNDKDDRQATVQDIKKVDKEWRALSITKRCGHPTCNVLVNRNESYCDKHKQYANENYNDLGRRNDPEYLRFCKSKTWQNMRRIALLEHDFICASCGNQATMVGHIVPAKTGWARRSDKSNLQPLCDACYNQETEENLKRYQKRQK